MIQIHLLGPFTSVTLSFVMRHESSWALTPPSRIYEFIEWLNSQKFMHYFIFLKTETIRNLKKKTGQNQWMGLLLVITSNYHGIISNLQQKVIILLWDANFYCHNFVCRRCLLSFSIIFFSVFLVFCWSVDTLTKIETNFRNNWIIKRSGLLIILRNSFSCVSYSNKCFCSN